MHKVSGAFRNLSLGKRRRRREAKEKVDQKNIQPSLDLLEVDPHALSYSLEDEEEYCNCVNSRRYGACKHEFPGLVF